jgi:hypothetical protein
MTYTCNKSKYRYNEHSFANRRIFYTYIYISNKYIQRERERYVCNAIKGIPCNLMELSVMPCHEEADVHTSFISYHVSHEISA